MEKENKEIVNSLAHTKWNCKYHIVFAPKYRRKVFCAEKRLEIREVLRQLCQWKGVGITEERLLIARKVFVWRECNGRMISAPTRF